MSTMHFLDPIIAAQYGLHEAIIICHFSYIIKSHRDNGTHLYEIEDDNPDYMGQSKTWCYYSLTSLSNTYPYISPKQLRNALDNLRNKKILISSQRYNKKGFDRTTWWTFVDGASFNDGSESLRNNGGEKETKDMTDAVSEQIPPICPTGQMHLPHRANGTAPEGRCINVLITNIEHTIVPSGFPEGTTINKEYIDGDQKSLDRLNVCLRFWEKEIEARPHQKRLKEPKKLSVVLGDWMKALRLLEEKDGASLDNFIQVHKAVLEDDFWKDQIRGITKYRKTNKDGLTFWELLSDIFNIEPQFTSLTTDHPEDIIAISFTKEEGGTRNQKVTRGEFEKVFSKEKDAQIITVLRKGGSQ